MSRVTEQPKMYGDSSWISFNDIYLSVFLEYGFWRESLRTMSPFDTKLENEPLRGSDAYKRQ